MVVLVCETPWAVPGQCLEVGPVAVDEVQHQEPTEHQVVAVAKTGRQHPQALRHAARQTGQGQDLGLLGETRSDGRSRSCIPGMAWTVKDCHP